MKMLVTGFEPFGKYKQNPSQALLHALKKQPNCETLLLKTEYKKSIRQIFQVLESSPPQILIMTGLAAGIPMLHFERFAVNLNDCSLKDNAGEKRHNKPIHPQGPTAYPSTLPILNILKSLRKKNIPASPSNSAGTYICNHLFYSVQTFLTQNHLNIFSGFIHLPCTPEQVCQEKLQLPSMPLETILEAITTIQEVCQKEKKTPLFPAQITPLSPKKTFKRPSL